MLELIRKLSLLFIFSFAFMSCSQSIFTDPSAGSCTDAGSANTGDGTCSIGSVTAFVVNETITLTSSGSGPTATFAVSGSVSGSLGNISSGSVQTVQDSNGYDLFSVTLSDGSSAYQSGDDFSFVLTPGSELKQSNFDAFDLEEVCSNDCDTGSATLKVPDGTTSDTAIQNSGDANTGITFDSTDVMQFIAGGVEVCEIGASSLTCTQDILPSADNTKDLGSASNRYAEIHNTTNHANTLRLLGSSSGNVELLSPSTVSTPYDIEFPDAEAASAGEAIVVSGVSGNVVSTQWGAAGDSSWQMQDAASGQIRFKSGSRVVNGIVETIASDITTNATPVAITNDTLTLVNASNGFLYEASDTIRIFVFYDKINDAYYAIGNSSDDTKFDYITGDNSDFIAAGINLSQHVPIGYVDVTASGSPGTVSVAITNYPVGPWTTFNNTAAAEKPYDLGGNFSYTNNTNVSTSYAVGQRIGNRFFVDFRLNVGGTGSGGNMLFTLPYSPVERDAASFLIGTGFAFLSGASTKEKLEARWLSASNLMAITMEDTGTLQGADLVNSDIIYMQLSYELADADAYNPITVGFPDVNDLVQVKYLTGNVTTNTTLSDLTTTVKPGSTYRVTITGRALIAAADNVEINCVDNSTTKMTWIAGDEAAGTAVHTNSKSTVFTAEGSSLTFTSTSVGASTTIEGDGTSKETHVIVEEIPTAGIGVLLPAAYVNTEWQDWSPTLTNGTNASVTYGRYRKVGKSVELQLRVGWSGAGSGGSFSVDLPVAPRTQAVTNNMSVGSGQAFLGGTSTKVINGAFASGPVINFAEGVTENGNLDGADFSNSGDLLLFNGSYEID